MQDSSSNEHGKEKQRLERRVEASNAVVKIVIREGAHFTVNNFVKFSVTEDSNACNKSPAEPAHPGAKEGIHMMYTLRSLTVKDGKNTFIELDLQFEGQRAFIIWESVNFGNFRLKALLEIDPDRLIRTGERHPEYEYSGQLELPRPEDN